jgi:hypothetical protein
MAKYGGLTGPGSHGFPGWPSKVPGAPSGKGRYNAPSSVGIPEGVPLGGGVPVPQVVPSSNFDAEWRQLIPSGVISAAGSQFVRSIYYSFAGSRGFECHSLEVECLEEPHRDYLNGNMPFELIYLIATADKPGEAYDRLIHHNPELPYAAFYGTRPWFSGDQDCSGQT